MTAPHASRPSFASEFPSDGELDALVLAFTRGDYRTVRSAGPRLLERARADGRSEVATATRELLERTRVEPALLWLYGLITALALAVAWLAH